MESVDMRTMATEMEGIKVGRENQGGVVDQARQTERHEQAYNRDSGARRSIATRKPKKAKETDSATYGTPSAKETLATSVPPAKTSSQS
jgi:hypothetical protein